MSTLTVIIDPGNFSTKYAFRHNGEIVAKSFSSVAHRFEQMEERLKDSIKRVKFGNFDYYIGEGAARFHSDGTIYRGNKRKGHHEGIIRIIAALHDVHKVTGETKFNIVATSPYFSIVKDREYFLKMLKGKKEAFVDGHSFDFTIENLRVAAEGLGASYFAQVKDCVIVDAGSMTLNILHLIDGTINSNRSQTLNGGTTKHTAFALADKFAIACAEVEFEHKIYVAGGKNQEIAAALEEIGYEDVEAIELGNYQAYFINVLGLYKKFEQKFEVMFS